MQCIVMNQRGILLIPRTYVGHKCINRVVLTVEDDVLLRHKEKKHRELRIFLFINCWILAHLLIIVSHHTYHQSMSSSVSLVTFQHYKILLNRSSTSARVGIHLLSNPLDLHPGLGEPHLSLHQVSLKLQDPIRALWSGEVDLNDPSIHNAVVQHLEGLGGVMACKLRVR